jgi:hypothetical protein
MLSPTCLAQFLDAYRYAEERDAERDLSTPTNYLLLAKGKLSGSDLVRLARTLDICVHLREASGEAAECADLIGRNVGEKRCLDFTEREPWIRAIQWALQELREAPGDEPRRSIMPRQLHVAEACMRLRAERHKIPITSDGPYLSREVCTAIGRGIDGLAVLLGGEFILRRVLADLRQHGRFYDGLWLFGDRVPHISGHKMPSMPWGYLVSLALKHIGVRGIARKPDVAWNSLLRKATDLATVVDCERYNQFDGMFLSDADFFPTIAESLAWREIFSLPQAPPIVIKTLTEAFRAILTADDKRLHPIDFDQLFEESGRLLASCSVDTPTVFEAKFVRRAFPMLARLATGRRGAVNAQYVDPLGATARNHDRLVFFEFPNEKILVLNCSLTASAMCEVIFRAVWDGHLLSMRAKDIVGAVLERSIALGCRGKTVDCFEQEIYRVGKDNYEMDVATRDENEVVFFEAKAKSLTAEARSFEASKFLVDYADSYLELVKQLARHEKHARKELTPLTRRGEDTSALRFTKVAISPLSYGPAADKALSGQLILSMANFNLRVDGGEETVFAAVAKYNSAKQAAVGHIAEVAPKNNNGLVDLSAYLIHVFWLDLGQLLYSLNRAETVAKALSPLRHLTFATRDFWTELAAADARGLLNDTWMPVTG